MTRRPNWRRRAAVVVLGTCALLLVVAGRPTLRTPDGERFTFFSSGSIGGPSFFTSTAGQPGGFLSIVTPIRVTGFQGGDPANLVPGFLRLELRFVPEPGAALLLGAGATSLLWLARSRGRSPRPPAHDA